MAEIKTKSVKLNMVMNALLSMSSFIFPLITFPYVSRILLPVGTGRVAFATAVVTYFAMFAAAWNSDLWYPAMCKSERQ